MSEPLTKAEREGFIAACRAEGLRVDVRERMTLASTHPACLWPLLSTHAEETWSINLTSEQVRDEAAQLIKTWKTFTLGGVDGTQLALFSYEPVGGDLQWPHIGDKREVCGSIYCIVKGEAVVGDILGEWIELKLERVDAKSPPTSSEDVDALLARVAQLEERLDELVTRDEAKLDERAAQMVDAKIKANFKEQVERLNEMRESKRYDVEIEKQDEGLIEISPRVLKRMNERKAARKLAQDQLSEHRTWRSDFDEEMKAELKKSFDAMSESCQRSIDRFESLRSSRAPAPAQPKASHADLALAIIQRAVERLVERAWKAPRSQEFVNMEEVDRGVKVSASRDARESCRFGLLVSVHDDATGLELTHATINESHIASASSVNAWLWAILREDLDTALAIALSINQINVDEEPAR